MSGPNREPQDTGDHDMADCDDPAADEFDQAFRQEQENCVELEFDSDDDVPVDSDGEELPANDGDEELGVIDEKDIYSDEEGTGEDDALAFVSHKEACLSVAVSPVDPRVVCTGGQDDTAILWALEDGAAGGVKYSERCRLVGHTDSVVEVAFSHDGLYVATGGYDGLVKIWLAATGALVHSLDGPSKDIEWLLWHPKGHAILAGSMDTMAWMWWAPTGKLMQIFAGHAQSVTSGCWGLGGKVICTGSEDKSVIVWNPRQGTPQQRIKDVHESAILTMCSYPDGPLVVTGSEDATARVIHMETGRVVHTLTGHTDSVEVVNFNNPGSDGLLLLASASMDGKALVWDGKTFDLRCTISAHFEKGGVTKLKWLPSRHWSLLATCSTDCTVRVHNGLTGACLHTLRGHSETVLGLDLALLGAGEKLCVVSASDDKTSRVFVAPIDDEPRQQISAVSVPRQDAASASASAGAAAGAPAAVAAAGAAAATAFQPPARGGPGAAA